MELLNQMLTLRSEVTISDAMVLISNGGVQPYTGLDGHPNKELIDEIDEYCSMVVRFLTASNWLASSSILTSRVSKYKTLKISDGNEISSDIDLLSMIYLHENSILTVFKEMRSLFKDIRSPLHQALIIYFWSESMEYWTIARSDEFYKTVTNETSPLSVKANAFFDYMYAAIEDTQYQGIMMRFLTTLLCLTPNVFSFYTSSKSAVIRRFSNSKKLKLLEILRTQLRSQRVGDWKLNCISIISTAGAVLFDYEPENPIVKFSLSIREDVKPAFYKYTNDMSPSVIHLYTGFFISTSIVQPEFLFNDLHKLLESSDVEPSIVCYIATGLRALAAVPGYRKTYLAYMKSNGRILRNMIFKQSRLLLKSRLLSSNLSRRSSSTNNSDVISLPILINVYFAFIPYPHAFFEDFDLKPVLTHNHIEHLDSLVISLVDEDKNLVMAATQFVSALVCPMGLSTIDLDEINIASRSRHHIVIEIYNSAGYLIRALSTKIIETNLDDVRIIGFLTLINDLLKSRAYIGDRFQLLKKSNNNFDLVEMFDARQTLYTSLESALLICLCSPDFEVYKLSTQIIENVLEDGYATENIANHVFSCPFIYNADQYREFCNNRYVITGQVALQKRIRKFLSQFTMATDGIIDAWGVIFSRSHEVKKGGIIKFSSSSVVEQNYLGVLCCLCGCILASDADTNDKIANIIPSVYQFVDKLSENINSPDLWVAESCKELLGRELSREAIPRGFNKLHILTTNILKLPNKEEVYRLLDQIISIMKLHISKCIEEKMEICSSVVDIAWLVINYLSKADIHNIYASKLKIRSCRVISLSTDNWDTISFRVSRILKYKESVLLSAWCEEASFFIPSGDFTERHLSELEHILKDLAFESARAVSKLTEFVMIDVPNNGNEEDYLQTRSCIFAGQFSLQVRLLEKWGTNINTTFVLNSDSRTMKLKPSSHSILGISEYSNTQQVSSKIYQYLIETLGNITKANMDVALKFVSPMGYHKNAQIRSAFLEIFTGLLQQGSQNIMDASEEDKYHSLMSFLGRNVSVCIDICKFCPASGVEGLATSLMNIYESQGNGLALLKAAIFREINSTNRAGNLLRRNTVATRMLGIYARKYGSKYLASTLSPLIQQFLDSPDDYVFDISEKIGKENIKAKEDVGKFMRSLSAFSDAFLNSLNKMPHSFREICHIIKSSTVAKFPEASTTSVGAFLLLRFFCPAIVAPETIDILKQTQRRDDVRRSLLLIAKVIQNMANGGLYSLKLPLLQDKINELNLINDGIVQFLKEASDLPILEPNDNPLKNSLTTEANNKTVINKSDMKYIHKHLFNHWYDLHRSSEVKGESSFNIIADSITSHTSIENIDFYNIYISDPKNYDTLDGLLESLGPPKGSPDYQLSESITSDKSEEGIRLYKFMTKNAVKDFGDMTERQLIREAFSKEGLPYLVVNVSLFDKTTIGDIDMVIYRYFQVVSNFWDRKWVALLDCSGFSSKNSIPPQLFMMIDRLFPPAIKTCSAVYFYNISSCMIPHLKITAEQYSRGSFTTFNPNCIPWYFGSSFYDTEEIDSRSVPFGLTIKTKSIIKDARIEFKDVSQLIQDKSERIAIELKINEEYTQICRIDPISFKCGDAMRYIRPLDVYHATDIKKVYITDIEDGFSISLNDGTELILYSKQRVQIVRYINIMVSRYADSSSTNSIPMFQRIEKSINDVAASFLMMALAGLNHRDANVRSMAYGLGCETCTLFRIETGKSKVARKGLSFPRHHVNFCSMVSGTISKTRPEITHDFIKAFYSAYINTDDDQRDDLLVYMEDWMDNIYQYVYLMDERRGKQHTREIFRNFINLMVSFPGHTASFHKFIWQPIFRKPEFMDILVDQIIESAIDKKTDGKYFEDILSLFTNADDVDICNKLITRLKKVATAPIESNTSYFHVQGSWIELTVLVKACIVIFFDSLKLSREFLPDLCFLCSAFIDIGPHDFRYCLQELTLNCLHTFTSLTNLPTDEYNKLNLVIERFSGSRAKLIFGLNKTKSGDGRISGSDALAGLEFICGNFLELFEIVGEEGEINNWRDVWASHISEAAFEKASLVRGRALIILGILSGGDSSDLLIPRVLNITTKAFGFDISIDSKTSELVECVLFCFTKLLDRISPNSNWLPILFWLGCASAHLSHRGIFLGAITLMSRALEKLEEFQKFPDGDIVGYLSEKRNELGINFEELDDLIGLKYSSQQFHIYICAILMKGLNFIRTRYPTLEVMEVFTNIFSRNALIFKEKHIMEIPDSQEFLLNPAVYLVFLYIHSRSYKESQRILHKFNNETKFFEFENGYLAPDILLKYIGRNSDQSIIGLYMAASLINDDKCEEFVIEKFVSCMAYNGKNVARTKFLM